MKTDSIFYRIFQTYPQVFFELVGEDPQRANGYRFDSIEVKQTAFRMDGVFIPEQSGAPIYFIEIQFQKNNNIYGRLFAEIFLYLSHNLQQSWRAIVLFASRAIEPDAEYRQPYVSLLATPEVQILYLDELKSEDSLGLNTLKLIIEPETEAKMQAQQLAKQVRATSLNSLQKEAMIELIQTIMVYKIPSLTFREVSQMLGIAESFRDTRAYQEAFEDGINEGLQEGINKGLQEGKLMAIAPLAEAGISVEEIAKSLELDLEVVKRFIAQHLK
ncbi:MAG: Rpn family recombination-promoting nuclease/putative transposase [Synechococcaceae cyanobacterium RL_1_2]|nr:Rpn family recombination-promoting nuclease/putative transposase [Synechococcaceae cyanobacterium RL_1_2]